MYQKTLVGLKEVSPPNRIKIKRNLLNRFSKFHFLDFPILHFLQHFQLRLNSPYKKIFIGLLDLRGKSSFLFLIHHSRSLFRLFKTVDTKWMFYIKICRRGDSNLQPLLWGVTGLPTEPQPLHYCLHQRHCTFRMAFTLK